MEYQDTRQDARQNTCAGQDSPTQNLGSVSDDLLLRRTADLMRHSRRNEAALVAHIGEIDSRRLYARCAVSAMFGYCTEVLHLGEHESYLRIAAARASRRHPVLLEMLQDGRLHLATIARLAPHLTDANRDAVLARAVHRSKREVEELIAELSPQPDVLPTIRKLPSRPEARSATPSGRTANGSDLAADASRGGIPLFSASSTEPGVLELSTSVTVPGGGELVPERVGGPPARIRPIAPARYSVHFTVSAEVRDTLERLQALMRTSKPDADLADVVEVAARETLARWEARRFGGKAKQDRGGARQAKPSSADGAAAALGAAKNAAAPRPETAAKSRRTSRYVPVDVRRAVHERDGDRCRYVDELGQRCTARSRLEFHHRHPFGVGGEATVDNISLVCHTHNRYLAEVDYGREHIARMSRTAPAVQSRPPEAETTCGDRPRPLSPGGASSG